MKKDSLLILSGFYQADIPIILEHAKALEMEEYGRKNDNDWACLILTT